MKHLTNTEKIMFPIAVLLLIGFIVLTATKHDYWYMAFGIGASLIFGWFLYNMGERK
jgi:hypothetical protein